VWRCAGLRDLADEAVQETWLTAVRRVRDFDPERGSFAAWLRGIAARIVSNHLRRTARQRRHVQPLLDPPAAADDTRQRETAEQIAHALAALPERYEAVLQAKYVEQRCVADIAATWGETSKAVESLLTRARQAFREAYQELERADG
jgi:RNA polymerase sigma-70 factor (ECF subfamily)